MDDLKKSNQARQDKLDDYEKNKKWNVDNLCHVVEERTIINPTAGKAGYSDKGYALPDQEEENGGDETAKGSDKSVDNAHTAVADADAETTDALDKSDDQKSKETKPKTQSNTPEKQSKVSNTSTPNIAFIPALPPKPNVGPDRENISMLSYHEFTVKYADLVEEFMVISSLDKSREFLIQHGNILLQENASSYLLLASLEDEMNGFRDKMRLTARQSQIISNITELAKTLKSHPGNVINPFFKRLEEKVHLDGFMEGLNNFVANLIKRAVVKRREMDAERALEEGTDLKDIPKEERLGAGGLDPVEVFESLPLSMQDAFESRDISNLKQALSEMNPEDAEMHMKRCVDSGLWTE